MKDLVLFGDCRKTLPAFIDEARMCVTSPPYYGLRDYGGEASQIGMEQTPEEYRQVDDNDCTDGKIAGALIGGGAGAAMSRGDGRWWAIPLGAVVGGTIGCDLNGG